MKTAILSRKNYLALRACLVFSFSILMAVSAYVRVPLFFTPVPLTLQTFVFYLSIIFLKRQAIFSQVIYLFLGATGLPVFTNAGAGLLYFFGPTGGYLAGFMAAAFLFPLFSPKENTFLGNFCYFSLIAFCVYSFGVIWLISMCKLSLVAALIAGVVPFILGETFKIALASLLRMKTETGSFKDKII